MIWIRMETGFKMETGQLSAVAIIVNAYLNLDYENKILFIRFFVSKINKTEFEFLNQTIDIRRQVKQEQSDTDDVGNTESNEDTENLDYNENTNEEAVNSETTDKLKQDSDPWYENPKTLCNVSFSEGDFKISFDDEALKSTVAKYVDGVKGATKPKKKRVPKETFPCDLCDKKFHQKHNYILHRRVHTGEKPFACDECPKTFKDSRVLIFHKRQHSGEKPYLCDQCPKAFTTKQGINKHKIIHTGERPFKCDECKKTFTQAVHMREHKRIHSGEKPYFCDQCPKAFNESGNLKQHQRTHSGEKPFQCDQCPKTFSGPSDLKKHKNFHLKPYSCDYCQKTFSRVTYLKGHVASNHSLESSLDPRTKNTKQKVSKSEGKAPNVSISSLIPPQPTDYNKHLTEVSSRSEDFKLRNEMGTPAAIVPHLIEYNKQIAEVELEECKERDHNVASLLDYRQSNPLIRSSVDFKQSNTLGESSLDYKQYKQMHEIVASSHLSGVASNEYKLVNHSVEALRVYDQSRNSSQNSSDYKQSPQESSNDFKHPHQIGLGEVRLGSHVINPMEYKSSGFI